VGFQTENKGSAAFSGRDVLFGFETETRVPPSPIPSENLAGRGFYKKSVCKILMSKSLEVKILRIKRLGPRYMGNVHRPGFGHDRGNSLPAQGQMSQRLVESS
jgi:hypothetical protein